MPTSDWRCSGLSPRYHPGAGVQNAWAGKNKAIRGIYSVTLISSYFIHTTALRGKLPSIFPLSRILAKLTDLPEVPHPAGGQKP